MEYYQHQRRSFHRRTRREILLISATSQGFIYLNPTKNVISLWHQINSTSSSQLIADPNLIYPNLLLDPKGEPRIHQSTPVSASTFSDGVDDVYLDEAVEGGYGQSQFRSAWGGGTDVKVLDRRMFRSSTGKDGGSFGGVMNSPAIYLHCACCEDLVRLLFFSLSRILADSAHR